VIGDTTDSEIAGTNLGMLPVHKPNAGIERASSD
jgi:hypothetical protein